MQKEDNKANVKQEKTSPCHQVLQRQLVISQAAQGAHVYLSQFMIGSCWSCAVQAQSQWASALCKSNLSGAMQDASCEACWCRHTNHIYTCKRSRPIKIACASRPLLETIETYGLDWLTGTSASESEAQAQEKERVPLPEIDSKGAHSSS